MLSARGVKSLRFEPITLLYGGNGCGKTTALNIIAEKLRLQRDTLYNRSNFFQDYVDMCHYETRQPITPDSRVITSDDVFDYMMNVRTINEGIDRKREELFVDYLDNKYAKFQLRSMADYEKLKKITMARGNTQSKYVRKNLMDNVRELSNGESAYFYFTDKIKEPGLYLLDEAGKQPFSRPPAGADEVSGGIRPLLRLPVHHLHALPLPARHARRARVRP